MTKYYTLSQASMKYNDGDLLIHSDESEEIWLKFDKDENLVYAIDGRMAELDREDLLSDKWQIKRAEPEVLSAEDFMKECYCGMNNFGSFAMKHAFDRGDKNGQLREWLRPEQVELRESINEYIKRIEISLIQEKFDRVKLALNNLKQPE